METIAGDGDALGSMALGLFVFLRRQHEHIHAF
jgi:hypothetical protein